MQVSKAVCESGKRDWINLWVTDALNSAQTWKARFNFWGSHQSHEVPLECVLEPMRERTWNTVGEGLIQLVSTDESQTDKTFGFPLHSYQQDGLGQSPWAIVCSPVKWGQNDHFSQTVRRWKLSPNWKSPGLLPRLHKCQFSLLPYELWREACHVDGGWLKKCGGSRNVRGKKRNTHIFTELERSSRKQADKICWKIMQLRDPEPMAFSGSALGFLSLKNKHHCGGHTL